MMVNCARQSKLQSSDFFAALTVHEQLLKNLK